jgi:uncharacterized RDD family membrane protein YckC
MTQPPDDSRLSADDPADEPDASTLADQPTVAWEPPRPDEPAVGWERPPDAPGPGPIISASPTGLAQTAPPAPTSAGAAPVSGWVMPDTRVPPAPVAGYVLAGVGARLVGIFLDWLLLGILTVAISLAITIMAGSAFVEDTVASGALFGVVFTGLWFLYFVGFWTSGRRATPGMRVLGLAVVTPVDGRRISITSAVTRWFLLTVPILATLLPRGSETISSLSLLWWLALLVTTAVHPARRGLHDRWSGTLVIRRADTSSAGVVIGCVLLIGLAVIATIVGLAFLGAQMETILSDAGQPI